MNLQISSAPRHSTSLSREYKADGIDVVLNCNYRKDGNGVILEGRLTGSVEVICGATCQPFLKDIDEELLFRFVEGAYKGFDEKYIVIETDGIIDIDEIIIEEIETFKLDYHLAPGAQFNEINL